MVETHADGDEAAGDETGLARCREGWDAELGHDTSEEEVQGEVVR